jgi:hypothetical protein
LTTGDGLATLSSIFAFFAGGSTSSSSASKSITSLAGDFSIGLLAGLGFFSGDSARRLPLSAGVAGLAGDALRWRSAATGADALALADALTLPVSWVCGFWE